MLRWRRDSAMRIFKHVWPALAISIVLGIALPVLLADRSDWRAIMGVTLAIWIVLTSLIGLWDRISNKANKLQALSSVPRWFYGMSMAHIGVGVFIVGVTLTSIYSIEKDVRLVPGELYELGGYEFEFRGVQSVTGPNYLAQEGIVMATQDGEAVAVLKTQKRNYGQGTMPMTEAGIDAGLTRDLYVSLGEPLGGADNAWSVRIYYKPFVRWIWLGGLFMGLGGLLAATDRRYRVLSKSKAESRQGAQAEGAAA
jgi:cytochrome c-type biogenesis protein CcmF